MVDMLVAQPPALSVSEVNGRARQLLERQFGAISVAGEVSGTRVDATGHRWFSLKDKDSVLSAVMFRRDNMALSWPCKDGAQVVARGRLTIYIANGRYQMVVSNLAPQGIGVLQAAFAKLRAQLQAEGLFDLQRKRPLPLLPRRVAVVSSPTGAVIRDIMQVATRRYPNCQILLFPVRVQGSECAAEVVAAIEQAGRLAASRCIDVLILARGGGSLEELWGFNDERVARALAASPLRTVSAVGHETDITIADLVADVRAPTPSAAAELVFPVKSTLHLRLQLAKNRALLMVRRRIERQRLHLRAMRGELGDGKSHLHPRIQQLALLHGRLHRRMHHYTAQSRKTLVQREMVLQRLHPKVRLGSVRARFIAAKLLLVQRLREQLAKRRALLARLRGDPAQWRRHVSLRKTRLLASKQRLEALSPLAILQRGYGIVLNEAGQVVRQAASAKSGQRLHIRVHVGQIAARVE